MVQPKKSNEKWKKNQDLQLGIKILLTCNGTLFNII